MKGHICHIEIPADDLDSLQKFYRDVFEWDFEKMPGGVEYYGIKHGEEKPTAGMMARQAPEHTPTFYVRVESVEAALDKAKDRGATEIVPRSAVKGFGWFAVLLDPQGNLFGLWQADENAA
jgi:predicted enzyme related to lactoylglutathione lyase